MSQPAGGLGFGPPSAFKLKEFMDRLTPVDNEKCWEIIDAIFDNLVGPDGRTRSLQAIEQVIGYTLRNPVFTDDSYLYIAGVNLPNEVHKWCETLYDINLLENGIAQLGQFKTFLASLDQFLTVAESENRQSTGADKGLMRTPLPQRLVKSWSDKLALLHWAQVRNNRPVNLPPQDIPRIFEEADVHANKIFDGMHSEPEDMVENLIQKKKDEKAKKRTKAGGEVNNQPNGDGEKTEGDPDAKKSDEGENKKIHAHVQRVRDMSDLSLYIMSWELYDAAVKARVGRPDIMFYSNESCPKNGRYKTFPDLIRGVTNLVTRSKASIVNVTQVPPLTRFAAHPNYELSSKVTNAVTNATRSEEVVEGKKVLKREPKKERPVKSKAPATPATSQRQRALNPTAPALQQRTSQTHQASTDPVAVKQPAISYEPANDANLDQAEPNDLALERPAKKRRTTSAFSSLGMAQDQGEWLPLGTGRQMAQSAAGYGQSSLLDVPEHLPGAADSWAGPIDNTNSMFFNMHSDGFQMGRGQSVQQSTRIPMVLGDNTVQPALNPRPYNRPFLTYASIPTTAIDPGLQTEFPLFNIRSYEPRTQTAAASDLTELPPTFGASDTASSSLNNPLETPDMAGDPTTVPGQAANSQHAGPGSRRLNMSFEEFVNIFHYQP
ncbi:hypothetical protein QBC32DRAFT_217076 [Pseudoneurospora amorphoporcata]|uniref:Uncharacterized protein n=1 Tax=Pseudoneurospora amorphoporcata TaxID=241081 RepID=A0AAN6NRJ4_9PEZI|nr:hypothetical protein QBC32DRAFT_217076 [Pseudoneurospora amorphoporcata]